MIWIWLAVTTGFVAVFAAMGAVMGAVLDHDMPGMTRTRAAKEGAVGMGLFALACSVVALPLGLLGIL